MARPMRPPVRWDRGSVSVAPIAQPFKGILEDFGIDESAYSAEGGFGGSGLLDWEPAELISPDVVWGTQYVSDAPPPSHFMDEEDKEKVTCSWGKKADGSCKPNPCAGVNCGTGEKCVNGNCVPDDGDTRTCLERGLCADCSSPPCDDDDVPEPTCADSGQCGPYPTCYPCDPGQDTEEEEDPTCDESGQCGSWPTCYPCDPGQDEDYEDDDVTPLTCGDFGMCGSSVGSCYPCDPGQDDTLDEEDDPPTWEPSCADYGQAGNWPNCFIIPTDWDDSDDGIWT